MTNPIPDTTPENPPVVAESATAPVFAPAPVAAPAPAPAAVSAPPPNDNRRRLRDLLSIAERDRTDEQWDEIIELEIQLAPGNRISGNEQHGAAQDRPPMFHNKPAGTGQPKKHRPRTNNPGGGGSGGGGGGSNNNNRRPRQNKPPSGGNPA